MNSRKKPPIVNAVTLCVNHNWPDHKYVLDIMAVPQNLKWSKRDKTYYTEDAIADHVVTKIYRILGKFQLAQYKIYKSY